MKKLKIYFQKALEKILMFLLIITILCGLSLLGAILTGRLNVNHYL